MADKLLSLYTNDDPLPPSPKKKKKKKKSGPPPLEDACENALQKRILEAKKEAEDSYLDRHVNIFDVSIPEEGGGGGVEQQAERNLLPHKSYIETTPDKTPSMLMPVLAAGYQRKSKKKKKVELHKLLRKYNEQCLPVKYNGYLRTVNHEMRFLARKKYLTEEHPPSERRRITFFNGGNAYFPFSQWPNVLRYRSMDIESGHIIYDNDVTHSEICLFFELDYRNTGEATSDEDILQHASFAQDIAKEYFYNGKDDIDFRMWILTCSPKPKRTKEDKLVVANGAHIVFPNIVVDAEQGRQMCYSLAFRLETRLGLMSIVDDCYKDGATTLRPAYARKIEKCHSCEDSDELKYSCDICNGKGKVTSPSFYVPKWLIHSSGAIIDDRPENLARILYETSIIPHCDSGDFTRGWARPSTEPEMEQKKNKKKSKRKRASYEASSGGNEIVDGKLLNGIRKVIVAYNKDYYKDCVLGKVTLSKDTCFVNLRGPCRCNCGIAKRKHSSNRIFFLISRKRRAIYQKCYSKDCKGLKGPARAVATTLNFMLFPQDCPPGFGLAQETAKNRKIRLLKEKYSI
jgi:hypothetical protein